MENEIINLLSDNKYRTSLEIIKELALPEANDAFIMKTLNKLADDYELVCTRKGKYTLFSNSEISREFKKGVFSDTQNDYGFVDIGDTNDIFVHGSNTNGAIDGDTVLVKVVKNKNNDRKDEGIIVKIINHSAKTKVGEVYHYQGKMMVQLDDKKFKKLTILEGARSDLSRLVDGDKIIVSLENSNNKTGYLYAKFMKRIGHINDPDIDILSIIAENGIDVDFPDDAIKELEEIPTEVRPVDIKGRRDLRDEVIFTIDGDDTKDIDDAISIKKNKDDTYTLGVHIADVSYYVKEDSPLDKAARDRGTSVYLTDRVIPMIPHQLSNGICSLNPNVDRLTVSCVMKIDTKGHVIEHEIFESVIKSRLQMTYNKVNDYLERGIVHPEYEPFTKDLSLMLELSKILRKYKEGRGSIDFDTDEIKILVDKDGHPTEITKRERGVGEKIIEDFMIAANETVATHLSDMNLPSLYRVHGEPSEERLIKFLNELNLLGIRVKEDVRKMSPFVVQHIIDALKEYPSFKVLNTQMLSCMDKAIYDVNNIGHFGIASKCYTHFTSPIRRYPDTTIHRLLHRYLFDIDGATDEKIRHFSSILPEIAAHSSDKERSSIECEREVDELKEAEYMEEHIGEEYHGMISSVTSFGFFVQLDNLIEGLVPLADLNGFYYNQNTDTIIGEKNKKVYMVGKEVDVKVVRASKEERIIDFELVGDKNGQKEEKEDQDI